MFPLGSMHSAMFLRREGVLEIRELKATIQNCSFSNPDNDVGICIEIDWDDGRSKDTLDSSRHINNNGVVSFPPESNFMQFAGPAVLQKDITIIAHVKEYLTESVTSPAKQNVLEKAKAVVTDGMKVLGENIQGRHGLGVPRAQTRPNVIPKDRNNNEFEVMRLSLGGAGYPDDAGDFVEFEYRWLDFRAVREEYIGSQELTNQGPELVGLVKHQKKQDVVYDNIGLNQLMDMEGCRNTVAQVWKTYYEEDPMFNSVGIGDCPPINEVLSVHGVNCPTDVGYAFRINTARFDTKVALTTRLELDQSAMLVEDYKAQGVAISSGQLRLKNGILLEEPNPGHRPSGDGVVPIHSLDHSENWKDKLEFNIDRIEGAEHKVLLRGEAFSKILLDRILWKVDGWSKECSLEFGPEYEALEGNMPVFDGDAHSSVKHTVASLNAGRLCAVAGHCIAHSKKHGKYYLLYRKGRFHGARSKLGPKWKAILDDAIVEKRYAQGDIDD